MAEPRTTSAQLQAVLFTKQSKYAVPDVPLAIPADVVIKDLNSIVNGLLGEHAKSDCKEVAFDFLVNGEFLRQPLLEHLQQRDLSTEDVVSVEYLEKHPAPEPEECLHHDDWVSAVRTNGNWILSGSYDNTLHIWTSKGKHRLTIPGHLEPVTSVSWIEMKEPIATFVSASQDQTAIIWKWNLEQNSVECVHVCRGHERSIQCVSVDPSTSFIATGAWDNMLKIWSASTDGNEEAEVSPPKKLKVEGGKVSITRVPIMTLQGHKEAIAGVVWTDTNEVCTCSWDHTLRLWDSQMGGLKSELAGTKAFMDVSWSPQSRALLTAAADSFVRLYDPRSTEGSLVKATFKSHKGWVSEVNWSATEEHLFISASFDMVMKLWDIRSPKAPLYDMTGHKDKIMCCDWSNPELMVSGGADNSVRLYSQRPASLQE